MLRPLLCLTLAFGLVSTSFASSTYRCNSKLVSLGQSLYEVRAKCGEPISEQILGYKQLPNEYGHTHEVQINEWIYGPKGGMYYYLRFVGGDLVKISSQR